MAEARFLFYLQQARIRGYRGAYIIFFCPLCNSKKNLTFFGAFFPTKPDILRTTEGRILIFPLCKNCANKDWEDFVAEMSTI